MEWLTSHYWLAIIFVGIMGLAILIYVILDGYDLGVGVLMAGASPAERDQMIASIGPFWDANETWLVLGIGVLLVAFPTAHGQILTALYLPVALMLNGLILRGVAFDFRAKVKASHKGLWDRIFILGSSLTTISQGYMLALYILGFNFNLASTVFGLVAGFFLMAGYILLGASWLIMKTEGELQRKAVRWARLSLRGTSLGMALVSITTPFMSERIFAKWFSLPNVIWLIPLPIITLIIIILMELILRRMPLVNDRYSWVPFIGSSLLFILGFSGLAYSFYPYIIPDSLTIWQAASAPESLTVVLLGVMVVLPCILIYTIFAYRVFRGKVSELNYY